MLCLLFVDLSRLLLFLSITLDLKSVLESVHACIILSLSDRYFKDALLRLELAELSFKSRQCLLFIIDLVEEAWVHSDRSLLKQAVHDFDGGLRGRIFCLAILSHGILDAFQ